MPKTFILVHGAWMGKWCFDAITPLLESGKHTALAVSLTGFGKNHYQHHHNLAILDYIRDVAPLDLTNHPCEMVNLARPGHIDFGNGCWPK